MEITIKTVTTRKELKTFVRFANRLYKGNPYYVPSMPLDDLNTLDKNVNAAFEFCEAEYFLAYKDDVLVGRVAAIINHKANKAWKVNQVRFGWFDFIDDIEVSKALLDAVVAFGKSHGMTQIVGPLGFTDFDPEGMLVVTNSATLRCLSGTSSGRVRRYSTQPVSLPYPSCFMCSG